MTCEIIRTYSETSPACHPERSEGSLSFSSSQKTTEILRFAQNDTVQKADFQNYQKL
jgi:hypothetical protein